MFKKAAWRNTVSDAVSLHQDEALRTTMLLLKSYGPTGFLLREEGEARSFKVFLGDPHTCTCPEFTKDQELCKHICWVLLRKFRVPREHEYSFQCGLVERQISELLHGLHPTKAHQAEFDPSAAAGTSNQPDQEAGSVCRKAIDAQDVCPICQEELLERKKPVCYCRFSCGNNVHVSCMKVWADHQKLSHQDKTVKCPLCREDFSSLKLLQEQLKNTTKLYTAAEREKPDRHLGVVCHSCRICPVTGKCFKCTVCRYFYLCEGCAEERCHPQHPLASRTKRRAKWSLVTEELSGEAKAATSETESDSSVPGSADPLPDTVLRCLPMVRLRSGSRLLDEGQQCRLCLQSFILGQHVRTLPCHHQFHVDCVDHILQKSNCCPVDGYVIYNPLTWRTRKRKTSLKSASCLSSDSAKQPGNNLKDLFVPGVALNTQKLTDRFQGLCLTATDTESNQTSSSSLNHPSPHDADDRTSVHVSQNRKTKCTAATPNRCPAATEDEDRSHMNLFVGLCRQEPDHRAPVSFPARPTRPQPKTRGPVITKNTNSLTSELTMTGVLISRRHQRETET